jgi:hypothetical protein
VYHCDERTRGLGPELLEVRLERVEGQERVWGQGGYGVRAFAEGKARAVKSRILQGRIPPLWTHLNDFCPVVSDSRVKALLQPFHFGVRHAFPARIARSKY